MLHCHVKLTRQLPQGTLVEARILHLFLLVRFCPNSNSGLAG